jgi:hypothetical protein
LLQGDRLVDCVPYRIFVLPISHRLPHLSGSLAADFNHCAVP